MESALIRRPFTVVRRALDLATGEAVALEMFPASLIGRRVRHLTLHDLIPPVQRLDHPGIVEVREIVTQGTEAALVSPWIAGETLHTARQARPANRFEVDEITAWMRSLVEIMEFAHAQGGVHGALDPSSIWIRAGAVCVAGFGVDGWLRLALRETASRPLRDELKAWSSPAVLGARTPSPLDDVFSFGAVAYELITGTPPVTGGWGRKKLPPEPMENRRRKLKGGASRVPRDWERLVQNCLEPNEHARLRSFRDVRIRLGVIAPESCFVLGSDPVLRRTAADPMVEAETLEPVPLISPVQASPAPAAPPPDGPDDAIRDLRTEPAAPTLPSPIAPDPPEMTAPAPTSSPPAAAVVVPEPVAVEQPPLERRPEPGPEDAPAPVPVVERTDPPPAVEITPVRESVASEPRAPARNWPPPAQRARRSAPLATPLRPPRPVTPPVFARHAEPRHRGRSTIFLRALLSVTVLAVIGVGSLLIWRVMESQRLFEVLATEVSALSPDATMAEREALDQRLAAARFDLSAPQWRELEAAWEKSQSRVPAALAPPEVVSNPKVLASPQALAPREAAPELTSESPEPIAEPIVIPPQMETGPPPEEPAEPAMTLPAIVTETPDLPAPSATSKIRVTTVTPMTPEPRDEVPVTPAPEPPAEDVPQPTPESMRTSPAAPPAPSPEFQLVTPNPPTPTVPPEDPPAPPATSEIPVTTVTPMTPEPQGEVPVTPILEPPAEGVPQPMPESMRPSPAALPTPSPEFQLVTPNPPTPTVPPEGQPNPAATVVPSPPRVVFDPPRRTVTPPPETAQPPTVALSSAKTAPPEDTIFPLAEVDVAPVLLERAEPVVPRRFRNAAAHRVEIVVVLDRAGRVSSALVRSASDAALVEPCLQAVRLFRYSPAKKNGRAVAVRATIPFVFRGR